MSTSILGLLLQGPIGRPQEYLSGVVGGTLKDSPPLPKDKNE
jgi:hypothetical protein